MRVALVTLNEEQIAYIIQDIEDFKANVNIHNTGGGSLTDWNPDHFDMEREEFWLLKSIVKAIQPDSA